MLRIRNILTAWPNTCPCARPKGLLRLLLVVIALVCTSTAATQLARAEGWSIVLPNPDVPRQRVSVTFSGRELRAGLERLASQQNVAIFLDRRVDPNQKIDVAIRDLPLCDAFDKIAKEAGIATSQLGPVTYFGPPETASKLRTLAQMRRHDFLRAPAARRRELLQDRPFSWNALATPRGIAAQINARFGLIATDLDTMPHDLWPAASIPPLDLADQLTLLAAGFDRTFEIDEKGRTWRFVPIPEEVGLSLTHPDGYDSSGLDRDETIERMREAAPDARITIDGKKINVIGTIENHERIATAMDAARQASDKAKIARAVQGGAKAPEATEIERRRITLKVAEARLGVLLSHVAKQLDIEFQYDERIVEENISLDQRVSVDVSGATVDEFFTAVLKDTGLTFRRQGRVVQIAPTP